MTLSNTKLALIFALLIAGPLARQGQWVAHFRAETAILGTQRNEAMSALARIASDVQQLQQDLAKRQAERLAILRRTANGRASGEPSLSDLAHLERKGEEIRMFRVSFLGETAPFGNGPDKKSPTFRKEAFPCPIVADSG